MIMVDEKSKRMALARLRGFRSHVTGQITQKVITEYHSILDELQSATGEDLQHHAIRQTAMAAGPLGQQTKIHPSSDSTEAIFTRGKYCDKEFFKKNLDLLWEHFERGSQESRHGLEPE